MTLRARRLGAAVLTQARLSDEVFQARHRVLRLILWLQLPILGVFALTFQPGDMAGMDHSMTGGRSLMWVMAAIMMACAVGGEFARGRRTGAALVSLGLLLSSALLVSIGGGRTDLHFGFFLVLGLISLYQDWLPLLMSVLLVTVEYLLMGEMAPMLLYSDPGAQGDPVGFALLHAAFVLAVCAVQVAYWGFVHQAQQETDRVRAESEQTLRRTAERFEALVQDSLDVIVVLDADGVVTSASAAAERVMGYRAGDLIGSEYHELIHPDDYDRLSPDRVAEVRVRNAGGAWHWHDVTIRDLTGHPAVAGVVVNHRDVSERRAFQERLVYEASHDGLTALANRAELLRTLSQHLAAAASGGSGVAVLYVDLDGFKQVNDTYGHEAGDALLVSVANSLQRSVLGSDTVGRLGGDEFAVVLTQLREVGHAETVAKRILAELARPVEVNGVRLRARASIGIAIADGSDAIETDALLHRADTAMYHAKRDALVNWRLYVDGMHDPSTGAMTLEDDLRRPVVTLDSGELVVAGGSSASRAARG